MGRRSASAVEYPHWEDLVKTAIHPGRGNEPDNPFSAAEEATEFLEPRDVLHRDGYLTVPEAARVLTLLMVPSEKALGIPLSTIPCVVIRKRGVVIGLSRRMFTGEGAPRRGRQLRTKRVLLPPPAEDDGEPLEDLLGVLRKLIFDGIFSNRLRFVLLRRDERAIPNRPETRALIHAERRPAFETGFVRWGRDRLKLAVPLIDQRSLQTNFLQLREIYEDVIRESSRVDGRSLAILRIFASLLKTRLRPGVYCTKQELLDASRHLVVGLLGIALRDRAFESQVWRHGVFSGLEMPEKAGKQSGGRAAVVQQAISYAKTQIFLKCPPDMI
jgi:hypothetical protein